MNTKHINIVDPCFSKNNLGKSISLFNSYRLKEAFKMQSEKLIKIQKKIVKITKKGQDISETKRELQTYLFDKYCKIFKYTFECTGMLPPLKLKLPQIVLNKKD